MCWGQLYDVIRLIKFLYKLLGHTHLLWQFERYFQADFDDDDSSNGDAANRRASLTDDDSSDEIDLDNELEGSLWNFGSGKEALGRIHTHEWAQ